MRVAALGKPLNDNVIASPSRSLEAIEILTVSPATYDWSAISSICGAVSVLTYTSKLTSPLTPLFPSRTKTLMVNVWPASLTSGIQVIKPDVSTSTSFIGVGVPSI